MSSSVPREPTPREQEIRERVEAATPGPWKVFTGTRVTAVEGPTGRVGCDVVNWQGFDDSHTTLKRHRENAALIAHAPGDLLYLLAELQREREEAASLRERNRELVSLLEEEAYHRMSAEGERDRLVVVVRKQQASVAMWGRVAAEAISSQEPRDRGPSDE